MADSTDAAAAGTVARGQRATLAAAIDETWRAFITHTQACTQCRATGLDCEPAAALKQAWRDARGAAA